MKIKYFLTLFFLSVSIIVNAQISIYKSYSNPLENGGYARFVSGYERTLVKCIDTVVVPSVVSYLVLDKNGSLLGELQVDSARLMPMLDNYVVGRNTNGAWQFGMMDEKGKVIIPLTYSKIKAAFDLIAVKNESKCWGVLDANGKKIIPMIYDDIVFGKYGAIQVLDSLGWGVVDRNGKNLIPSSYNKITQVSSDSFLVVEHPFWEQISFEKKKLFSWIADSVTAINDSVFLVYEGRRKIIRKSNGKVVGSERGYHQVIADEKGFTVYLDELCGRLDLEGMVKLPIECYAIESNGSCWNVLLPEIKALRFRNVVNRSKKRWALYDSTYQEVHPRRYRKIRMFSEGLVAIQDENYLWGFLNNQGKWIVPTAYKNVIDFRNGKALLETVEGNYTCIDVNGNTLMEGNEAFLFYYDVIKFRSCNDIPRSEGEPETELFYGALPYSYEKFELAEYGYFRVFNGRLKGVLHPDGHVVVYAHQDTIYKASADTFFLYKRNDGGIGYSDKYGNISLRLTSKFENVEPLYDRYSRFKKDGLFGFIDAYGNVQVAPKYINCTPFSDGMAGVLLKNKWGFIDQDENLNVQPYYKEILPFRYGFAPVKTMQNKWIFIDKKGKQINSTLYDNFYETKNNKYIVVKGKRIGITNKYGKEILFPKYDYVEELGDDLYKIKKDGKFGVMDSKENIILYYEFDALTYNPYSKGFLVMKNGLTKGIRVKISK